MTVQIKFADTEAEREAIYRFRHTILTEEGHAPAEGENRLVSDPIDTQARLLLAIEDDQLIGTVRVVWGADAPFPPHYDEVYDLARFSSFVKAEEILIFDRFVVHPAYRGTEVPFNLMAAVSVFGLNHNIQLAFCDCMPHLLPIYLRLGFRTYAKAVDTGVSVIMIPLIFVTEDVEHLRQIRSPFLPLFEGRELSSAVPDQVKPLILQDEGFELAKEQTILEWVEAYNLLTQTGTTEIGLFQGISKGDVTKILNASHIRECKAGEKIIQEGENYIALYVILSGTVEIRSGDQTTALRTEGDVVGEIGFLLKQGRIADVVALSDGVRILSFRERTLHQLEESDPALAAKLMRNLARIVALKLATLYAKTNS